MIAPGLINAKKQNCAPRTKHRNTIKVRSMSDVIIYHNPRCSKSRQTLALLEKHNIQYDVVLYLESPPSEAQLASIIAKLGLVPRELLRKGEDAYKEQNLEDTSMADSDIVAAMVKSPILIQRPIVVSGERAKIGRPPEQVLEILNLSNMNKE